MVPTIEFAAVKFVLMVPSIEYAGGEVCVQLRYSSSPLCLHAEVNSHVLFGPNDFKLTRIFIRPSEMGGTRIGLRAHTMKKYVFF